MSNLITENHITGCYGIHVFSHSPYQFILGQLCFAFGGHHEQFDTKEKLTWGRLNCMPGYNFGYVVQFR